MASRIDVLAKCELRSVIRFLQAEGNSTAEIHRRMSRVYGGNFMSDGVTREWYRKLKTGESSFMMKRDKNISLSQQKIDLVQGLPGSFWSSLNGTCLITQPIAPT
ncbi:hypothetical protein AVEN_128215-1 [Araneus ventricosus]|uniref:Mos1 transposase HTH domain-containing protein n=1 Tax=Araneus ventricosus TaxID=182803 RepID=A0A4Y1ZZX3_ARAVE|nr:hypothetical protein AVEN_128215-1 [Araneus ventricosus]